MFVRFDPTLRAVPTKHSTRRGAAGGQRYPLVFNRMATDSAAPQHLQISMYALYVSSNGDCTAATVRVRVSTPM